MSLMIDIQGVLETYGRAWVFEGPSESKAHAGDYHELGTIRGFNAHILIIPFEGGNELAIRCGGNPHTYMKVEGSYVPLMLKNIMQPQSTSDHVCGCHKLNYGTNPKMVEAYAKSFDRTINKLYVDVDIHIRFDYDRIDECLEGLIPVVVTGCPYCIYNRTYKDEEIHGYLCMGNCV